jgi:hypothetical protein
MMFTPGDKNYKNKNSGCDVLTFETHERPDILRKLKKIKFGSERVVSNYETINWFDFECITVLLKDDEILGFSSVWHREEFYEPDKVRILNRYWEHDKLRKAGVTIARPHLVAMVNHQITYSKQLGFKKAFISREKNSSFMSHLMKELSKKTDSDWDYKDEKVCVCNEDSPSCWQYIGTTNL